MAPGTQHMQNMANGAQQMQHASRNGHNHRLFRRNCI
jgi:hypothetical protein